MQVSPFVIHHTEGRCKKDQTYRMHSHMVHEDMHSSVSIQSHL